MISKQNFALVRTFLEYQVKDRGLNYSVSRESWDTFSGWIKRGKQINKGSKGFKVELVVPYSMGKTGNRAKIGFVTNKKTLFSETQTFTR